MARYRRGLSGVLFVLGLAIGAVALAPGSASTATIYTRYASCAGLSFYPADSRTGYSNVGPLRVRRPDVGGAGTGVLRCDPGLPNGATVTKLQATAKLLQLAPGLTGAVSYCALRRSALTVTGTQTSDMDLARVSFVGAPAGLNRLTDTTITNAKIDNSQFGYWIECALGATNNWSVNDPAMVDGIYGADVVYRISASNG